MKKFMVIFGIVCVLFCGTVMVGFTNNQNEEVQEEISEEVYYSEDEMNEFSSQVYDFFYNEALVKVEEGYDAYDFMDYMTDEYGFDIELECVGSYFEDGQLISEFAYVACKELSTGQILKVYC